MALTTGRLRNPVTGAGFTRRVGGVEGSIRREKRRAEAEGNTQYANTLGAQLANENIKRAGTGESAFRSADSDIQSIIPAGRIDVDLTKKKAAQAANLGAAAGEAPVGAPVDPAADPAAVPPVPPVSDAGGGTGLDRFYQDNPFMRRSEFDPTGSKALGRAREHEERIEQQKAEAQKEILWGPGGRAGALERAKETGIVGGGDPIIDPKLTPPGAFLLPGSLGAESAPLFPSDLQGKPVDYAPDPFNPDIQVEITPPARTDETPPKPPAGPPTGDGTPSGTTESVDATETTAPPPAGEGVKEGDEEEEDTGASASDLGTTPSSTLGGTDYLPGSKGARASDPGMPTPATPATPTALAAGEAALGGYSQRRFDKKFTDSLRTMRGALDFDQSPEFKERNNLIRETQGDAMAEDFGRRTRKEVVNQFEKRYGTSPTVNLIERMRDRIGAGVRKIEGEYAAEAAADPTGRLAGTPLGRVGQLIETARRAKFGVAGQEVPPKWTEAVGEAAQTELADWFGEFGREKQHRSIVDMDPSSTDLAPRITSELQKVLAGEKFLSESRAERIPLSSKASPHELRGLFREEERTQVPRDIEALPLGDPGEAPAPEDPLGEIPPMTQAIGDSPFSGVAKDMSVYPAMEEDAAALFGRLDAGQLEADIKEAENARLINERLEEVRRDPSALGRMPGEPSPPVDRIARPGSPDIGVTPTEAQVGPESLRVEPTAAPLSETQLPEPELGRLPEEGRQRVALSPDEEQEFQEWWATNENVQAWKKDLGNPNKGPDDPRERFDYREAWKAGDVPQINPEDNRYHWGSTGKDVDHPTWHKQFGEAGAAKAEYQSLPTDEKVERLATLSKPANATERSALRSVALNADRAVPPEVKADMSTEPLETLEFDPGDGVEFAKNEGISHPFALSAATLLGEKEGSKGKPNKKLGPVFNRLASQGVTGPQSDCSWCAAFVTHAVKEAGGKIPTIIAARKFLNVGATVPEGSEQEGDIGVMWNNEASTGGRDGWGGHAIVILSQDENSITGIGGNQDHAVSIMTFPREMFLGVRRIKK